MSSIGFLRNVKLNPISDFLIGRGLEKITCPINILSFRRSSLAELQQSDVNNKCHHRYVLVINLETRGIVHIDNIEIPLTPNQATLIHPYQFHHYTNLESTNLNWLFFTFELPEPGLLLDLKNSFFDLSENSLTLLEILVIQWKKIEGGKDGAKQLQCILAALLSELSTSHSHRDLDQWNLKDRVVARVNDQLTKIPISELCLDRISQELDISTSRLRFRFKESAGISLGKYLLNYKLNRAIYLLKHTQLSISEIAHKSGFQSIQAFSRSFKSKFEQKPSFYRIKA